MLVRKRFGQHFLHDPGTIERIVASVGAKPAHRLLEIGPGQGIITTGLLAACGRMDAIEIDRDLAADLRARYESSGLALHVGDALKFDYAALAMRRGGPLRVVGNLPYNISTPLLFRLLDAADHIVDMHVMLQKEVVDRMAAQPGDEDYGRLTVMLAPRLSIEKLFEVGPGAFHPPPRVWSAVVKLTVLAQPRFATGPHYAKLVASAFAQRRKTLRNSLRGLLTPEQIQACGIDPGIRPERVAPAQFSALAELLPAQ
ncbi:MAG: 16S rRNA (adenine(1518)-N(6)/adenine(1519)-N(6))-dimethyltransferase RsmA [Steroidobacteraceae bacterium]